MNEQKRERSGGVSLKSQLLTIVFLILLLIAVAVAGTMRLAGEYVMQEQNDINRAEYTRIANLLSIKNGTIQSLMDTISYLNSMRSTLSTKQRYTLDSDEDLFLSILCSYSYLEKGIENVVVVNDQESKRYVYQFYPEIEAYQRMIDEAAQNPGYSDWDYVSGKRLFTISAPIYKQEMTQSFARRAEAEGTCIFFMDMDALEEELGLHAQKASKFMLVNEEGKVLSDTKGIEPELCELASALAMEQPREQTKRVNVDGQEYAVYANTPDGMSWRIIGFAPVSYLGGILEHTAGPILSVWLVVTLLIVLLVVLMFSSLYGFIRRLTAHMELIKQGVWNQGMERGKQREFMAISEGFDSMMQRISALSKQNMDIQKKLLEEEIDKRQTRLLALQAQINPHFLYNTLECMKSIGVCYGVEEVQVIAEALAYMFRYSIKGANIVQVSDELTCVKSYMAIQNVRYSGRFALQVETDARAEQALMPKMLLQPLVENALRHGLEERPGEGCVWLSLSCDGAGNMLVKVQDDGIGMEKSRLERLRDQLNHPGSVSDAHSDSLGLMNVRERLALYYGERASMQITSERGRGTCVLMRIPAEMEGTACIA